LKTLKTLIYERIKLTERGGVITVVNKIALFGCIFDLAHQNAVIVGRVKGGHDAIPIDRTVEGQEMKIVP
jgi:hypothetical protein